MHYVRVTGRVRDRTRERVGATSMAIIMYAFKLFVCANGHPFRYKTRIYFTPVCLLYIIMDNKTCDEKNEIYTTKKKNSVLINTTPFVCVLLLLIDSFVKI